MMKSYIVMINLPLVSILLGSIALTCDAARIKLKSRLETFTSVPVDWMSQNSDIHISSIEDDQWISGNILATVGNALYTINRFGHPSLLTGSLQIEGLKNGKAENARFNKMAGILQILEGSQVIITDYGKGCLRSLNRFTNQVSAIADSDDCYKGYGIDSKGELVCHKQQDGALRSATFCTPVKFKHSKSKEEATLLDITSMNAAIRRINLKTYTISTIYEKLPLSARDFLVDEDEQSYIFPVSPGILKLGIHSGRYHWLAGCKQDLNLLADCQSNTVLRNISMKYPLGIAEKFGVYFVSDYLDGDIYIIDSIYNRYARILSNRQLNVQRFYPTAVALIGDYLYIGEAIHSTYNNRYIHIRKVKLSISCSYDPISGEKWLDDTKYTSTAGAYQEDGDAIYLTMGLFTITALIIYGIKYAYSSTRRRCCRSKPINIQEKGLYWIERLPLYETVIAQEKISGAANGHPPPSKFNQSKFFVFK